MAGRVRDSPAGGDPRTKRGYGFAKRLQPPGALVFRRTKRVIATSTELHGAFTGSPFMGSHTQPLRA